MGPAPMSAPVDPPAGFSLLQRRSTALAATTQGTLPEFTAISLFECKLLGKRVVLSSSSHAPCGTVSQTSVE